ncbi:MAG: FAD-dependent oxidoreductase [Pseudomonadota bacterium]
MAEPYVIKMPQLSDTMTEGVIVSWEKNIGDEIKRGDIVATVETDKAVMDVEVFRDGYLSGPIAAIDSTVPVTKAIAYLVESKDEVVAGEAVAATQPATEQTSTAAATPAPAAATPAPTAVQPVVAAATGGAPVPRPQAGKASPLARRLAGQVNADLDRLSGSGPGGVITAADIQHAPAPYEVPVEGNGRPMKSMEKAIANAMASSLSMPTFRVTSHIHLETLIAAAKQAGVSVTVAIARACALAMQEHPKLNWCYQPDDKLIERSQVDIGMAVAADDGGLVVPVLRGCEARELAELNKDWKDLVARARTRHLNPDEFKGSTFQISNMGMFDVSYFDAIATPGLSAILAISSNTETGSAFTITADHRVINGADVAKYLYSLKSLIEQPYDWMGPGGPAIPAGDWDYDVVVVGGGPGGEDCARDLVAHKLKVALVNDSPFPGGECLWRGCIPSKAWRAAADRMRDRAGDAHLGVAGTNKAKLVWKDLEAHRRKVLETRGDMALKTDKGVRINYLQGFGQFVDTHTLAIHTSTNQADPHTRAALPDGKPEQSISFGAAVIATGAPPFVPPIPGAQEGLDSGGVLTSDTVWALTAPPKKLAVIGAGAIGIEMAQIFQDFGARVTLLEAQERILAEVEPEIAKTLAAILDDEPRLDVHTSAAVNRISGEPGAMKLAWTDADGKKRNLTVDYIIMATGKRPVLDGLGLDAAGVASERNIVQADTRCRTSVPHIFAVGDVIGGLMLAHTAAQQGRVTAATLLGENMKYDQDKDCGVIFSRPQAAFVGLSVEQAKAKGMDVAEVKVPMNIDAKAMINNETHGMIKIVADRATHRIVGVHLLADHADTLIGEAVMMVSANLTLEQVGEAIHAHPTQTELFGDLARRLLSRLRRSRKTAKA